MKITVVSRTSLVLIVTAGAASAAAAGRLWSGALTQPEPTALPRPQPRRVVVEPPTGPTVLGGPGGPAVVIHAAPLPVQTPRTPARPQSRRIVIAKIPAHIPTIPQGPVALPGPSPAQPVGHAGSAAPRTPSPSRSPAPGAGKTPTPKPEPGPKKPPPKPKPKPQPSPQPSPQPTPQPEPNPQPQPQPNPQPKPQPQPGPPPHPTPPPS